MKRTIDLSGVAFDDVWNYASNRIAKRPNLAKALYSVAPEFFAAKRDNLRFDRKTHTLRDDRSGILSRPVAMPTDDATIDCVTESLARYVWIRAIRKAEIQ